MGADGSSGVTTTDVKKGINSMVASGQQAYNSDAV